MIPVSSRASTIEYAIRDVVVPATKLESEGHNIIKLNIGDPIAYPGLPTPPHMVEAYRAGLLDGNNGYSPSYGLPDLREAIADDETSKGWNCSKDDVYVCHGVTEALQIIFAATLEKGTKVLAPGPHYPPYMAYPQMYGASTVEYALKSDDGWSIDLDDIESKMENVEQGKYNLLASSFLVNAGHPDSLDSDGTIADIGALPYLNTYSGPIWYVKTDGSDISGKGSTGEPFGSIQSAINFSETGDSVCVLAGIFYEHLNTKFMNISFQFERSTESFADFYHCRLFLPEKCNLK